MNTIRLTLTIDLPPDGSPEYDRVMASTLAELLGRALGPPVITPDPDRSDRRRPTRPEPPVRPHREPDGDDEPANVQAGDDRPTTGPQLLGWINHQPDKRELLRRAGNLGRKYGCGTLIKAWQPDQVARVYRELSAPGWGGGRRAQ